MKYQESDLPDHVTLDHITIEVRCENCGADGPVDDLDDAHIAVDHHTNCGRDWEKYQ